MHAFPDVELATPRTRLRAFQASDVPALQEMGADPVTQMWMPLPSPFTEETALSWITATGSGADTSVRLVRAVEVNGRMAGTVDFKRTEWAPSWVTEIGYISAPWARSQGFITEAVVAMTDWAIGELGFHRVVLRIAPANRASLRVAEKAGFVREGVARSAGFLHGGRVDLVIFSRTPADSEVG